SFRRMLPAGISPLRSAAAWLPRDGILARCMVEQVLMKLVGQADAAAGHDVSLISSLFEWGDGQQLCEEIRRQRRGQSYGAIVPRWLLFCRKAMITAQHIETRRPDTGNSHTDNSNTQPRIAPLRAERFRCCLMRWRPLPRLLNVKTDFVETAAQDFHAASCPRIRCGKFHAVAVRVRPD